MTELVAFGTLPPQRFASGQFASGQAPTVAFAIVVRDEGVYASAYACAKGRPPKSSAVMCSYALRRYVRRFGWGPTGPLLQQLTPLLPCAALPLGPPGFPQRAPRTLSRAAPCVAPPGVVCKIPFAGPYGPTLGRAFASAY